MTRNKIQRHRLLVSIHDVGPRSESQVDRLRDHLASRVATDKIAMLVVPNHWGQALIVPGSSFARRLRSWAEAGAEMFVHGWFHRDGHLHTGKAARFKAHHMTAGEGEFLGLDGVTSRRRMNDGKALIEDVTGRAPAGFIAPAWLYSPAALIALSECGFALAEDHWKVWEPCSGRVLCRSPVLTWASRSALRIGSSLLAARLLPPALRASRVARLAVHPGDVAVPQLMTSIDRATARLTQTHRPARYADLLAQRHP